MGIKGLGKLKIVGKFFAAAIMTKSTFQTPAIASAKHLSDEWTNDTHIVMPR